MGSVDARTRVAIVDAHVLFAECLEVTLNLRGYETRLIPVPARPQATPLATAILRARPTVVIVDLDLGPGSDRCHLIPTLVTSGVAVVVVTAESDRSRWGECLVHGARTVVSKEGSVTAVTAAIRRIQEGAPVMPREEFLALVRRYHETGRERWAMRARLERLTARENEVLGHLMVGHSVSDIARRSVVSEATVRTQVKSILSKLEVTSQLAAVSLAHHARSAPRMGRPQAHDARAAAS